MTQTTLPLYFSVPSANEISDKRYDVVFDGTNWYCDCKFMDIERAKHKRNSEYTMSDCRHILEKRLETKGTSMFSGVTVEPLCDEVRLCKQYKRVFSLMVDGEWRTLSEIALETDDPLQSISARLRDFRKARFGGHQLDRRRRGDDTAGLFEYRLVVNAKCHVVCE
jgi:hypothetical protein